MVPHGGRLEAARRRWPGAPEPWIDLSTGINPEAYPFAPPPRESWTRLPEPEEVAALELAAARAYRLEDAAMAVAAPGTQALIQLLPRLLPQSHVTIDGPTYAEHEASWAASGATIVPGVPGAPGAPARVLCNPNNPDGRRHDPATLHADRLLVVDEAYADFEPGLSLAPLLPRPGVIVLRSFGKAYGLAGLRLGFALCEPALAARLREALGPWAVSGPAIAIGRAALLDDDWRAHAASRAKAASHRLAALLAASGLEIVGGTALFQTAAHRDALALAGRLGEAGLLVRAFDHSPQWLRFGLPPDPQAWTRLGAALAQAAPTSSAAPARSVVARDATTAS